MIQHNKKIDILGIIKIKNLGFKGHHQESGKTPTEWEKIFANLMFDKGLVSRIPKRLLQFHNKKINNPVLKMGKHLNRHFSKEKYINTSKH